MQNLFSNGVTREAEMIVLCVRWYLRYAFSYRDLEEMMCERGLHVDHTTIYRWVHALLHKKCYLPVPLPS
jgi:transposase-like protein